MQPSPAFTVRHSHHTQYIIRDFRSLIARLIIKYVEFQRVILFRIDISASNLSFSASVPNYLYSAIRIEVLRI
jgi:hypothetical protein